MELCVNAMVDWVTAGKPQKTERILWLSPANERVVLIDILDQDSIPYEMSATDLLAAGENGDFRVLAGDPYALAVKESAIPEKHRRRRDRAWGFIAPIVELPDGRAFDAKERFCAIAKVCSEERVPVISIYRYLRRY